MGVLRVTVDLEEGALANDPFLIYKSIFLEWSQAMF